MPRIRTIKPTFFQSEDVSALPLRARLTWIGLWTHCDDQGRTEDNARLIKARIWPLDDVSLRDVEDDLITLADHGRIVRYEVAGRRYLEVANWGDHQKINRPTPSRIPAPQSAVMPDSSTTHAPLSESSPTPHVGKGKEGKGKEGTRAHASAVPAPPPADAEPPSRCSKHTRDPSPPPCGACADARRTRDAWRRQRADTPTPAPPPFTAPAGDLNPDRAHRHAAAARAGLPTRRPDATE